MNNPYDDKRVVVDAIGGKNEPLLFGEQGGAKAKEYEKAYGSRDGHA